MIARCLAADATHAQSYQTALSESLADVLLTDPPYCLLTRRRRDGSERDKKGVKLDRGPVQRFDDVRSYRAFTRAWLSLAVKHLAPSAPLVVWSNLLGRQPIREVAAELGWPFFAGEYVWGKRTREGNSGEEILRVVETALVLLKAEPPPRTPQSPSVPWAVVAGYDDDGEAKRWGDHPNHKPFGVMEPLVRTYSAPGQVVLDPFAGSGSIGVASLRLGRQVASLEKELEWAQRVNERYAATLP